MSDRVRNYTDPLHHLLADNWAISTLTSTHLGGELDQTFRVVDTSGARYCMKIRTDAGTELELELAVLGHLRSATHLALPQIVYTSDGSDHVRSDGRAVWVLDWLDGMRWADLEWRSPELNRGLGRGARQLALALEGFDHPAAHRTHHWDVRQLEGSIERHRDEAQSDVERSAVARVRAMISEVQPLMAELPQSVVHQDLNDHNVIVSAVDGTARIAGIIDFGDVLHSATITELAVAVAYSMLRTEHPVDAAADVVAGWYEHDIPTEAELRVIFPLALGRLMVNALTWSARRTDQPEYADARSRHTWAAIDKLIGLPTRFVEQRFREACDVSIPGEAEAMSLEAMATNSEVYSSCTVVDLDPRREEFDGIDPTNRAAVFAAASVDLPFAVGHDSVRLDRGGFADGSGGPATIQLGVELHLEPATEIALPMSGAVVECSDRGLLVRHDLAAGQVCSLWNGFTPRPKPGDQIASGGVLGSVDSSADDPSLPEPVGVQLLRFAPEPGEHVPRFIRPIDRAAWTALSIDPSRYLGLAHPSTAAPLNDDEVRGLRNARLASSQRYYYREPMTLVRAHGVTFVDADGHHYLDAINNVTHVGHGNERVVEAAARQLRRLNTNSRFVYEQMGAYADRLASLLPDPLEVVFLVCTGSEANDLALRISRQVTGHSDIVVVDGAYHGNTTAVTGISPNRYKGAGGDGPPPTTHEVAQPNQYRGPHTSDDPNAGHHYAASVRDVAARLVAEGRPPAAFIAESLMGTAGQVIYPTGYLAEAFAAVRAAGGLCISDEVQVGFGRLGTHFWGFQQAGVVPDIVTMGKPMGNGHPTAAVVTTREIADAFDQGMKYFNTFGGNPVSCAVAGAVLDEIEGRGLQDHALRTGARFLAQLRDLASRHECIGDVRGEGLYLGVEFVRNRVTKEPNSVLTTEVCERMRERGVIVYPNGVFGNCLKIKPPMPFDDNNTDQFVNTLDLVLNELTDRENPKQ